MSQVPQRIGDAERDRAVRLLREHHAAGRLDAAEFDERMRQALSARTQSDLDPLFADLPVDPHARLVQPGAAQPVSVPASPTPSTPGPRPSDRRRMATWVPALWSLMWVGAFVVAIISGFDWWWVWLIPIVLGPVMAIVAQARTNPHRNLESGPDGPPPLGER